MSVNKVLFETFSSLISLHKNSFQRQKDNNIETTSGEPRGQSAHPSVLLQLNYEVEVLNTLALQVPKNQPNTFYCQKWNTITYENL